MNKARAKALAVLVGQLQEASAALETIASEEREAFDNMPEGLQASERGQLTDECANTLETVRDTLDGLVSDLEGLTES